MAGHGLMCFCQTELQYLLFSVELRVLKIYVFTKEINEKTKNHTLVDIADFYMH